MNRVLALSAALAVAVGTLLPPEHVHFDADADHREHAFIHRHSEPHKAACPHDGVAVEARGGSRFDVLTAWLLATDRFAPQAPAILVSQSIAQRFDVYVGPLIDGASSGAIHDPPRSSLTLRGPPALS